ncbi:hypothetical protein [Rhodomicrobium udaipurense]|uniref:hypothetical protein n=1 Tax=Rhodomicrobium udaipurense TaxID=1202716 RepID=UPI001FD921FC|nr:hypothetical protein [Rhodomicrobium udaipurense]
MEQVEEDYPAIAKAFEFGVKGIAKKEGTQCFPLPDQMQILHIAAENKMRL